MSDTTKVEVYDIGLSALRQLLANAGYPDMCDDVSVGDYVVAYGVARFGRCSNGFMISKPMSLQNALVHVLACERNDYYAVCMGLCGDAGFEYEIWHVLDDSKEFCGNRRCPECGVWLRPGYTGRWCLLCEQHFEDLDGYDKRVYPNLAKDYAEMHARERELRLSGYTEEQISLVCSDDKACREFRDRAEILKVLRQLPDSPILYDVMRYDSKAHQFVCVGANLRYSVAHDMVRRYERGGSVSFLCESVTCRG